MHVQRKQQQTTRGGVVNDRKIIGLRGSLSLSDHKLQSMCGYFSNDVTTSFFFVINIFYFYFHT